MNKINTVIGISGLFIIIGLFVWLILMCIVAFSTPSIYGKCKYREQSVAKFHVNNGYLTSDEILLFDSYAKEIIDGDEVITVQGYWKLNGLIWEKCDGKLRFITKVGFNPILLQNPDNSMQILEQDCK